MSVHDAVLFGLAGGVIAEFASIALHRYSASKQDWPAYVRTWWYWVIGLAWVGVGGFLAGVYESAEGVSLSPLAALNVGLTAPLIVERLIRAQKEASPGDAA